jgi:hypothetical protein
MHTQQTVAWCDKQTGEIRTLDLVHDPERSASFIPRFPNQFALDIETVFRDAVKSFPQCLWGEPG